MPNLTNALRAVTAAALMGSFAFAGAATATADPNTGGSADINTLASSLSKGYGLNNCTPQNLTAGELAALTCGQSPDPSGPVLAKYVLFGNSGDLTSMFTHSINEDVLANCGDAKSPNVWHQGSSADTAGRMACGTYQNQAEIIWTTDTKSVLSYIRASNGDVPSLYQWWRANG